MNLPSSFNCQACGGKDATEIEGFAHLPRVTSDSKPFRPGGRLFVCNDCGLAQKTTDAQWLEEIGEIYRDYEMYHQSTSNDQPVFDPASGRPRGRCEVLAQRMLESGAVPRSGALLDVGAGSGAMLGAFSSASEGWELYGLDLDERKVEALKAIPRFKQLYTVPPEQLSRQFDLVTLVHSLEHFTEPLAMLQTLRGTIAADGQLFIQVNNVDKTAFDLIVADHLCHFNPQTLQSMVTRSGLGIASIRTDWVNKEISLLASKKPTPLESDANPRQAILKIKSDVAWLNRMLEHAYAASAAGSFGIFGTSVAATWLANSLADKISFFVDEDPARNGRSHLGRPILLPHQIPAGATVYLAFVQQVSDAIAQRLSALPIKFTAPPAAV